jgi:hypothetical protein
MTRLQILTVIILRYHAWQDHHESPEDWQARAGVIAQAIEAVSANYEERAFLVYMGKRETCYSLDAHRGKLNRNRHGQYWGLWQVKMRIGDVYSWAIPSIYTTTYMAELALDLYRQHRGTGTLVDGIRGYVGYRRWTMPRMLARRVTKIRREIEGMATE